MSNAARSMSSEARPIVVVGSINVDLVAKMSRIPALGETMLASEFNTFAGGKGANQAVAVARLGYPVRMIGRVGSDVFGERMVRDLKAAGVDTSAVGVAEGSTGVAMIAVAAGGENSIIVAPGANSLVTPEFLEDHADYIRNAGMVLAQLEIPLASILHLASLCEAAEVPLMLDPAPACALPDELFPQLAWITPNETEARALVSTEGLSAPEIAKCLLGKGARGVILKLGARGCLISRPGEDDVRIGGYRVDAVDTTAAGDSFNGAFATGLMLGKSIEESGVFASAAAAVSVTRSGAQLSMPTLGEVREMLRASARFE